ncbi:hypothetical protein D9M70_610880 [compost metagenome]
MEVLGGACHVLGHHHRPAAIQQRAEQLPYREVEGVGVEHRPHVTGIETEPVLGRREQPDHVLVRQQRALGLAGGAGGVDHVGQVLRGYRNPGIGAAVAGQSQLIQRQALDGGWNWQHLTQVCLGQQ